MFKRILCLICVVALCLALFAFSVSAETSLYNPQYYSVVSGEWITADGFGYATSATATPNTTMKVTYDYGGNVLGGGALDTDYNVYSGRIQGAFTEFTTTQHIKQEIGASTYSVSYVPKNIATISDTSGEYVISIDFKFPFKLDRFTENEFLTFHKDYYTGIANEDEYESLCTFVHATRDGQSLPIGVSYSAIVRSSSYEELDNGATITTTYDTICEEWNEVVYGGADIPYVYERSPVQMGGYHFDNNDVDVAYVACKALREQIAEVDANWGSCVADMTVHVDIPVGASWYGNNINTDLDLIDEFAVGVMTYGDETIVDDYVEFHTDNGGWFQNIKQYYVDVGEVGFNGILDGIGGFFGTSIAPGVTLGGVIAIALAVLITFVVLRFFAGG